ncbi:MAG: tetratricopeptide repeat protein [Promethearchaeota archaeon]|jgi:tetratricopeptide (TPR) repeat protein
MSYSVLNQLSRAEELFNQGNLQEALEILNDESHFEGLTLQQKSHYQDLKGLILIYQNKSQKLIELGESMLREGQELKENLHCVDGLFFISMGFDQGNQFEEALKNHGQAENLLGLLSNLPKKEISRRKFRLSVLKTMIDIHTGKMNVAEESLEELLHLQDEHAITWELIWAILNMGYIKLITRGDSDVALEYSEKAMRLAKNLKFNHFWLGYCQLGIGLIYMQICEYDMSLKLHMKSLECFQKINNNWYIAIIYNNLGGLYGIKGEYNLALKYLEDAIILWEPYPLMKQACLDTLIWVSLEKGDVIRAQKYFQYLEDIYKENKISPIQNIYLVNKARFLKRSSRFRDKAKAEELFKNLIDNENLDFELKITSYVNLCDLLLAEYRLNSNDDVLEEVKHYIKNLLNTAENSRAYDIFCNAFILQAKLALLSFDFKSARRFLSQAQKITESFGIESLAMKISHEHDELIKQSKMWENLDVLKVPLSERWKLAGLNEQIEIMVKKRLVDISEAKSEEPVLLLIVSEGGVPYFTHSFIEDKSFESHLFGGFLSTIDYFISEMFSEGLDRAMFGEHTLLMKSISPFFISYIFKGDSYFALQKLDKFQERLQKEANIWQKLLSSLQNNISIQLKDSALLETLITEIFI